MAAPKSKFLRFTLLVGAGVLVLVVIGWLVFRPAEPPSAPVRTAAPVKPAASTAPVAPVAPKPAVLPVEKSAPAAPARMSPEIEEQLRKLNITARRTGQGQRIVVGGKVIEPGDTVIGEVVLEAVFPDRVVFRNAANERYERRF